MAERYPGPREHLHDELAWLDQLLEQAVRGFSPPARPVELEQFGSLILGEQEVLDALRASPGAHLLSARPDDAAPEGVRAEIDARLEASRQAGAPPPLARLAERLGLSPFERNTVLLALAPELNRKYEKVFGYLHDDVTRRLPTVDLALTLFCAGEEERWAAAASFHPGAPLRLHQLVEVMDRGADPLPLPSRRLRLEERIVSFLTGDAELDAEVQRAAELVREPRARVPRGLEDVFARLRDAVRGRLDAPDGPPVVVHLYGRYGAGRQALAEAVCADRGLPLLVVDLRRVLASPALEDDLQRAFREAVLQPAAVAVRHFEDAFAGEGGPRGVHELARALRRWSRLTFLIGEEPWTPVGVFGGEVFLSVEVPAPDHAARVEAWREALPDAEGEPGELAAKFAFTPGQIRDAVADARAQSLLDAPEGGPLGADALHAASRRQATPHLDDLARKIEPAFTWSDIVLPPDPLGQLKEIAAHVHHADTVMGEWGFGRRFPLGRAVTALFSGASGTGKTMAAEIIAGDLRLDLYRIDLSGVVSKYIGETEKNLNRIFAEAQSSNAILFFDEADALFGKRSEVKDSHDRYANIEVAYLLQRMEEYDGIVILATNLRKNMDAAFVRRMRFIIDFPFPDAADRERIWRTIFPDTVPLAEDVDFGFLARKLNVTGGNIK
ncbi:MAG TPA: AAA family ATPase, partial [Longimicrobium sp.]|nr:AAA family ATPase [Longimicrobium sp.]